jgi:hypothetical protein
VCAAQNDRCAPQPRTGGRSEADEEASLGPMAWVRSIPAAARDLVEGTTRCHPDLVGGPLRMSDGRTYVPFRHTRRAKARWSDAQPPAVLQPRFHLELLPARRLRLHALFRVVCIVTTPFFVGLRGFRSKLWMVDPETGDFAGLYEWDDAPTARTYAEGLARVLRVLSAPGSVSYDLVEGMTVDAYLHRNTLAPSTPSTAASVSSGAAEAA